MHGRPCTNEVKRLKVLLEHIAVEEEESTERLVLRGSSNVSLRRQVGQEGADITSVEFARMSAAMEENETPNPTDVGFLCAPTVMASSRACADLVKKSRGLAGGRHM